MIPVIQWDGESISKAGVYAGIPMDAYHGQLTVGPSISSSGLRTIFHESPRAYYRESYLNPDREEKETSKPFIFGRGAHHLLLGESDFRKHFVIRPLEYPEDTVFGFPPPGTGMKPWNGNAKWCRNWLGVAEAQHLTVLTDGDIKMIRAMAKSLSEEPLIQAGILSGLIECSFVWQDEATGVWLKWRPDALPTDSLNFSDLKTTADVSDIAIERTIGSYGYNMQGALGSLACKAVLGREMDDFTLVFVEKVDVLPSVRTKTIRQPDIELGMDQISAALGLFDWSLKNNKWLGPGGEQHDAEYSGLSSWAHERARARIDEITRLTA